MDAESDRSALRCSVIVGVRDGRTIVIGARSGSMHLTTMFHESGVRYLGCTWVCAGRANAMRLAKLVEAIKRTSLCFLGPVHVVSQALQGTYKPTSTQ